VINTNLLATLHRLRNVKNRYIWLPFWRLNSPSERFPSDDLHKIFSECQGTKWRENIAENFNQLSRVHERYRRQTTNDRQTTDRWTGDSIIIANLNVSSRSLKSTKLRLFITL